LVEELNLNPEAIYLVATMLNMAKMENGSLHSKLTKEEFFRATST
jgi:hypothetical protein